MATAVSFSPSLPSPTGSLSNSTQLSKSYGLHQDTRRKAPPLLASSRLSATPTKWKLHGRINGAQWARPFSFSKHTAGFCHVGAIVLRQLLVRCWRHNVQRRDRKSSVRSTGLYFLTCRFPTAHSIARFAKDDSCSILSTLCVYLKMCSTYWG